MNRITVTVDLDAEPWSALTEFDNAFQVALAATAREDSVRLAKALDAVTASASDAAA